MRCNRTNTVDPVARKGTKPSFARKGLDPRAHSNMQDAHRCVPPKALQILEKGLLYATKVVNVDTNVKKKEKKKYVIFFSFIRDVQIKNKKV